MVLPVNNAAAIARALTFPSISLDEVPVIGSGQVGTPESTRRKKVVMYLLWIKPGDGRSLRISRPQPRNDQRQVRYQSETVYDRFILASDAMSGRCAVLLTRSRSESDKLLRFRVLRLGDVIGVVEPIGMGSLQRDGTRILSTLDPFIPLHINQPVERPLDVDGVTNTRYSLAYLRGVRVGISRSGPAENICGGTLCDGQLAEIAATRGCCCVGTPRQSCWAVSLVVQLTGDEFDEDMQLTSMRLTALFATPVAMRAPIEAVDTILLEDSVDEIVRRVNDDYGGWTLTIWSKSAQAVATEGVNTGGGIRPPRRHLVRMEPTAALTEEQQGVLDGLKYTGVARRNLGEGAGDNDDAAAGDNGWQGQQRQGHHHNNNANDSDGDGDNGDN